MKRILTAVVLIPLVLLAVLRAPLWLFLLLSALAAVAAAWEYLALVTTYGLESFRALSCFAVALLFLLAGFAGAVYGHSSVAGSSIVVLLLAPFMLLAAAMAKRDLRSSLPGAAMGYLALPYIGLPLLLLAALRERRGGWALVLFLFFAVWVGDTAAMYVGKTMGRHKLAPRISPGKTVEGTVASLLFAVAVCTLFAAYVPEIARGLGEAHLLAGKAGAGAHGPLWLAAVLAAVINAAAQVGDLLESALKRGAGVKDSGSLLPGHGGMLDRIDALLLASPVGFILLTLFGSRLVHG